ncbi:uncharacterized protein LOC113367599 [Ctenocephalides felis]|uniref:uncharacterized protein LOC113367599 n=1 Tax=Ctenocephalides felis TaxID=7515 RepID=UPI000E6E1469|nr:uncharacterized protein LOC113367599 [Ctenocephalides felis]
MSLAGTSDVENEGGSDYRTSATRPSGLRVGLTGRSPSNGGFKASTRLSQDKLALWDNSPSKNRNHHDSDSDVSETDHFLTKGAFLLTPSHDLSMDRAAGICEKMNFRGCFSLTKTATGILFKFSDTQDYQAVFRKGFHKVTGARFYRKVPIPCRPQKTFTLYVLDVPENLPEEDVRHSLYKFSSVVEVVRLYPQDTIGACMP